MKNLSLIRSIVWVLCFLVLLSLFKQKYKKAVFFKPQVWLIVGVFVGFGLLFFFKKGVHLVYIFSIFISSQILLLMIPFDNFL